jgi:ribosomal protein S18 acetylase RimI-like enzyme
MALLGAVRQSCCVVEILVLTPDNWATWRHLRLAALREAPYAFGSQLADWAGDGDVEERWRGRLATPASRNVVAILDDHGVGMASGVPTSDVGVVELISMWVAPGARGRGVGDVLVRDIERWARTIGAQVLRLSVAEDNAQAAALYQRHGFRYTGELGDMMADGVHRERVMEKAVASHV